MWRIMIKVDVSEFWNLEKQYEWRPMRSGSGNIYEYLTEESARKDMIGYYGRAYYEGRAKIEKVIE